MGKRSCIKKTYTFRDVERILKDNGYEKVSSRGSHMKYENSEGKHITMNIKPNRMVVQRVFKDFNLTA